ncbi:hypothetical protein QAD02_003409 [Eretmocerus hayati]|uniref:Uncharacterized protein n=1 Tax=Eretmocerus hayati TaxID=131215 RepID=A0ACC2NRI5_9HYME|nr:hypothetical protein QAD02_003409 [Eretmocerus hayati]
MTQGFCSARIEGFQKLWKAFESDHNRLEDDEEVGSADNYFTSFESDHNRLEDDEEVGSADNYFTSDIFSQVGEAYYSNMGLYKDHALQLQWDAAELAAPEHLEGAT